MTSPELLAQALDEALAALAAGETAAAVLARQPALAEELRPLLAAAQAAGGGRPTGGVPRQAQAASRAQFLAQASRLRGAAAVLPAARRPARWLGLARAAWLGGLLVAGFAAIGYTAVAASAESLPGDPLYPIKRAAEDTQLLLTTDSAAHERLEDSLDQRRSQEVEALSDQGRIASVDFTGRLEVLPEDGAGLWIVGGVPVRLAPDAQVDGNPEQGDRLRVIGILQTNRTVLAQAVFVLRSAQRTPTPTPTASATATSTSAPPATATATPSLVPSVTATRTSPPPTATLEPTDDHGGENESETPQATEDHGGGGGPSPSNTPQPTNGGGGGPGPSPSNTAQPTNGGGGGPGPSPSNTPQPTNDGGGGPGPSPSNTPEVTDDHGGGGGPGPSPSNTPDPDDDDGGGGSGSGGGGEGGGGSGPSPSNTPKPDEGD